MPENVSAIPVFAGLGSDALFSAETLETARKDAESVEGKLLLQYCHQEFHRIIENAVKDDPLDSCNVSLEDFASQGSLLSPNPRYNRNVVVQHVVLYLVHALRYIHGCSDAWSRPMVTAGFCVGLLPAAAIATSSNFTLLLSRLQQFFHVAIWLGIRSEHYRQSELALSDCPEDFPWSAVVDKLSGQQAKALLQYQVSCGYTIQDRQKADRFRQESTIHIAAYNSATCVTLSGRGDELKRFITQHLQPTHRCLFVNVFSLYHHRERLSAVKMQIMADIQRTLWSARHETSFSSTLLSTIDGSSVNLPTAFPLEDLIGKLLDLILLEPTDWLAVRRSITALAQDSESTAPVEILNFGPGLGFSCEIGTQLRRVQVLDASKQNRECDSDKVHGSCPDDIAIVGIGLDLPGASDMETLWRNITSGIDFCSEIPSSRFNWQDFMVGSDSKTKRKLNTKYGTFLENPFMFDNELFNISPREARSMDPQQRVLLQTAYRALEDAGYTPDSTPSNRRETFGCWIGNSTGDYTDNLRHDIDVYYSTGTLRTFLSGRISYMFGWSGPSIVLDTACSSSVVALHQASRSIAVGDCRAALVGAVNTITSPDMYLGLDRAHFLSPSGQCKAFDESADGYCRAEGCVAFVIKKVEDALADGDHIHAIIKAVEIRQSGNTHSITHPHVETQVALFENMLEKAKVSPYDVTAVEMHGTGTQAGDSSEMDSVRRAFCIGRDPSNLLHITSIKANIGHCEAASGLAGLLKLALMLKHARVPPQISLQKLNSSIPYLGRDGTSIARHGTAWTVGRRQRRIALLNNFGAGGSNGAVLLQEHLSKTGQSVDDGLTHMMGMSAKSEKALSRLREDLVDFLESSVCDSSVRDVCATMTSRRMSYAHRIAVTGCSVRALAENLRQAVSSKCPSRCPPIIFAFSGQGVQYMGMGRELLSTYPEFAEDVRMCDSWLTENGYPGCLKIISSAHEDGNATREEFEAFQCALFVLEVALARLLQSWSIVPTLVIGHSLGEYAALVIAGVLDLFGGLALVAQRARLMMGRCDIGETALLTVDAGIQQIQALIDQDVSFKTLSVACSNGPSSCVVGGRSETLLMLSTHLLTTNVRSKLLDVLLGFHTEAMDPILEELNTFAKTISVKRPLLPIVSNVLGRLIHPGEDAFSSDYFGLHCRKRVAFEEGIYDLTHSSPYDSNSIWIEIGPHPTLLPMLHQVVKGGQLLPTIRKSVSPSSTLSQLLCGLYRSAIEVDWRKAFCGKEMPKLAKLPGMPFFQEEFKVQYREHGAVERTPTIRHPPLDNQEFITLIEASESEIDTTLFQAPISRYRNLVIGRVASGGYVCPTSVYHEMVFSAVEQLEPDVEGVTVWVLSAVKYLLPLVYVDTQEVTISLALHKQGAAYSFNVTSKIISENSNDPITHCTGLMKRKLKSVVETKFYRQAYALQRSRQQLKARSHGSTQQNFQARTMYERLFTRVAIYPKHYQRVHSILINEATGESLANCGYPEPAESRSRLSTSNVIFLDVPYHVAEFAANIGFGQNELFVCSEMQSCTAFREPYESSKQFEVYCVITNLPDEHSIIADAYTTDTAGILAVFKGMLFQRIQHPNMKEASGIAQSRLRRELNSAPAFQPGMQTPFAPSIQDDSCQSVNSMKTARECIARTCDIPLSSISSHSSLTSLGVDTLMMTKLYSAMCTSGHRTDQAILLEACRTVDDFEGLWRSTNMIDTRQPSHTFSSLPSNSSSERVRTRSQNTANSASSPHGGRQSAVMLAIAETCGMKADEIAPTSELHALGFDSLMILELIPQLEKICAGRRFLTTDLSNCDTIGDIEKLVLQA